LLADWITRGATVRGLRSYQEIDESVVTQARLILLDSPKDCTQRGNLTPLFKSGRIPASRISGTVAERVAGTVPIGRTCDDDWS
jgi:ornithine cyclodeaminase/alanine dehydrogenase-like protein (mu-crystallin family)